jgi:ArsR family transcriptional regulator
MSTRKSESRQEMGSLRIAQNEELFCGERHAKSEISGATLSHHLEVLSNLGLITSRKEGLNVYYRAIPEKLGQCFSYLAHIGQKSRA